MTIFKTKLFYFASADLFVIITVSASGHREAFLVCRKDPLPEAIQIFDLIVVELLLWTSCQRVKSFASRATFDSLVAAVDLGPRFLEDEHPDLVSELRVSWPRECPLTKFTLLSIEREIVIDNDGAPLAVNVELNSVTSCLVDLMRLENT